MSRSAVQISVVIPSWNTRAYLAACLRSLQAARKPETEVIVVENASTDGSAELVAERFPECRLIRNQKNEGFARGCNQGMDAATGRYVLLLNTDTELDPETVQALYDFLDAHPEYGAAAPRLVHADGRTQPSVHTFPNLWTPLFFGTPLERWFPNSPELRRYFMRGWDQESSADVDQPPAACILLRREALDRVGTFDERLWLFYNDVDLSRRLEADGWRTRYIAEVTCLHHVGASTKKFGAFVPEWHRNRLVYYRKHHGWLAGVWIKFCATLTFVDWALGQLAARLRRRPAEPIGPTARFLGRFLGS